MPGFPLPVEQAFLAQMQEHTSRLTALEHQQTQVTTNATGEPVLVEGELTTAGMPGQFGLAYRDPASNWQRLGAEPPAFAAANALPHGEYDGQRIVYNPANYTLWDMYWYAGSWFYVGGPPLYSDYEGGKEYAQSAAYEWKALEPKITLPPYAGYWDYQCASAIYHPSGEAATFYLFTTEQFENGAFLTLNPSVIGYGTLSNQIRRAGAASQVINMFMGMQTTGTFFSYYPRMWIAPVYLTP